MRYPDDTAFRFVVFGRPEAPWRPSRREALLDALDAGQASQSSWAPHPITVTWPGDIQGTSEAVATVPRPVTPGRTARGREPSAPPTSRAA